MTRYVNDVFLDILNKPFKMEAKKDFMTYYILISQKWDQDHRDTDLFILYLYNFGDIFVKAKYRCLLNFNIDTMILIT